MGELTFKVVTYAVNPTFVLYPAYFDGLSAKYPKRHRRNVVRRRASTSLLQTAYHQRICPGHHQLPTPTIIHRFPISTGQYEHMSAHVRRYYVYTIGSRTRCQLTKDACRVCSHVGGDQAGSDLPPHPKRSDRISADAMQSTRNSFLGVSRLVQSFR